jgi:hypothetical protein
MTHPMDFRELLEARSGLPSQDEAARKIATFAVIPAAIVGLFAGTQLVDVADPFARLVLVCTVTASGAGFGVLVLVLGTHYLFGFRPIVVLADALLGSFIGFLGGATLTLMLMWFKLMHHNSALWGLLIFPLGAVVVPLVQYWREKTRERSPSGQVAVSPGAEPGVERETSTRHDSQR